MFNRILRRIKDFGNRILESRLFVLILVFCILSAILISRLFYLQIVKGDYYLENYKMQIRKTREIPEPAAISTTGTEIFSHTMNWLIPSRLKIRLLPEVRRTKP